jgi:hypothetical protein
MSLETPSRPAKGHRPWSMIAGLVIVPVSAWAAFALVPHEPGPEPAQAASPVTTTQQVASVDQNAAAADLVTACGEAGLELVAGEASGSLSGLQQAGLDALREICAQEGMPLPGKPAPEPIIETIVVTAPAAAAVTANPSGDGEHEEEHEDEHEEEQEHEEEHEDEGGGD